MNSILNISLSDEEFQLISNFVYNKFGIKLTEQKRTLVVERLQKFLRLGGFNSFKEYFEYVINDKSGQALVTFIDKISTHHTFFFRENEHFNFLTKVALPEFLKMFKEQRKEVDIRIWSAGCSSGEEPYTIAMCVCEFIDDNHLKDTNISILATDISISSIEKAQNGVYDAETLIYIPKLYRSKYFTQIDDEYYEVKPRLKKMVLFRRLNLMRDVYPFKSRFHIIFCRNVMIYFDIPTRQGLISRFHRYTFPNGYLFIGHSETLGHKTSLYEYIKPAIYKKIGD